MSRQYVRIPLIISLLLAIITKGQGSELDVKFYINPSHLPPEMGMTETATNFISFYDFLDYAICKSLEPLQLKGPFYRFARLFLWDISNINWLATVVHELGHGQRIVDSGAGVAYSIWLLLLLLALSLTINLTCPRMCGWWSMMRCAGRWRALLRQSVRRRPPAEMESSGIRRLLCPAGNKQAARKGKGGNKISR